MYVLDTKEQSVRVRKCDFECLKESFVMLANILRCTKKGNPE